MEKYYNELNKIFLKNEYNNLNGAINESKLLHLYCYYHYFNGDEDNIYDVCESCKFTKENNNYEYAYIEDENSEDKTIDILSVFYEDEFHKFEMKKIKYILGEIENSINQIKNGIYTIKNSNSKLIDMWDKDSETILSVKILTNYIPESEEMKETYLEELSNYDTFKVLITPGIIENPLANKELINYINKHSDLVLITSNIDVFNKLNYKLFFNSFNEAFSYLKNNYYDKKLTILIENDLPDIYLR